MSSDASDQRQEQEIEQISRRIFQLSLMFWSIRQKARTEDPYDLTESEFLTLDALAGGGTCTVGDLQRHIGVLPAQMSRIIRSLESKADQPLISCSINPHDKRKIDVALTELGKQEQEEYQARQLESTRKLMAHLDDDQRGQLAQILETLHKSMSQQL